MADGSAVETGSLKAAALARRRFAVDRCQLIIGVLLVGITLASSAYATLTRMACKQQQKCPDCFSLGLANAASAGLAVLSTPAAAVLVDPGEVREVPSAAAAFLLPGEEVAKLPIQVLVADWRQLLAPNSTDAASVDALFHVAPQIASDLSPWLVCGVTAAAISKTLAANSPAREGMAVHAVTIKDGFLVFDVQDLEAEVDVGLFDKTRLFVEQLNSVVAAGPELVPDVTFLMTSSSLPYLTDMPANALERIAWTRRRAPVFSIAKREGDGDVLMPNPYFGDLAAWDVEIGKLLRRAQRANVWSKRLPKLHWRGSCSAKFDGVLPRLLVLLAWGEYPGFDIAFSNQCLSRLWQQYHPTKVLTAAQIKATANLHRRRVEVEDLPKFKYLLHLPGASSGSYSRSLQYQLTAGAVILKYDNPYREFYYSSMVEGVHFVTVNLTSVGSVFEWLRANDDAAAAMGAAVLRFASHHLRAAHILSYWRQLFSTYAAMQRFPVTLPLRGCICPGRGPDVERRLAAAPSMAALPRCKLIPRCDV